MKAVAYVRISKEEQSHYSLEEQVAECKKYIAHEGHEWVDTYIDDGYSAKDTNRPALQQMLKDIPTKKFGLIVIWKLDRLTRDTLDGLTMVKDNFKPYGVEFASKTEDIDTTTPDGFMMFTIRLSMAQAEREKIRERVIMGQAARARAGFRNSSIVPYGYKSGDNLQLIVDEEKAEIVKRIFNQYLQGYGKSRICMQLEIDDIEAPKGGRVWHHKTIATILENPAYIGVTDWKQQELPEDKRIIVEGTHEPIIDRDIFDKVQEYITRRREKSMSRSTYDFAFSTIVKCALCGCSFHGRHTRLNEPNRTSRLYYCRGNHHPRICDSSTISERKLVKLIFGSIQFDHQDKDPNRLVEQQERLDHTKERKRIEKELAKSKLRQTNLAKAMSSGDIDFDIYVKLREEEKVKCDNLESQLAAIPEEPQRTDVRRAGEIMEELNNLKRDWDTWTYKEQKLRIQKLFKRISIVKVKNVWKIEEIEIHY